MTHNTWFISPLRSFLCYTDACTGNVPNSSALQRKGSLITERKYWQDLSPAAKIAAILTGVVQVSLLVAALVDLARRPAQQVRGPKWAWALVSFINFFGPISYFLVGRKPAPQELPPA
jgi:hypothetical protein